VERQRCLLVDKTDKGIVTPVADGVTQAEEPRTSAYVGNKSVDSEKKKKPWSRLKKTLVTSALAISMFFGGYFYGTTGQDILNNIHRGKVRSKLELILNNTPSKISPYNINTTPKWIGELTPRDYVEQLSYGTQINVIGEDVNMVSELREKKALMENEIRPAFSSDKIENRLRDPSNNFFGTSFDTRKENYMNTVLTMLAMSSEDFTRKFNQENIASFTDKQKQNLISLVKNIAKPNEFYDDRCVSLIKDIEKPIRLDMADKGGSQEGVTRLTKAEEELLISKLDDLIEKMDQKQKDGLMKEGLAYLLENYKPILENNKNAAESDGTNKYVSAIASKYLKKQILEIRLLMLETMYNSKLLGQNPFPSAPYIYHLEGERGLNALVKVINDRNLQALGSQTINNLDEEDLTLNEKREEFVKRFSDMEMISKKGLENKELSLRMLFESLRFNKVRQKVKGYANYLVVIPYIGEFGLPVEELKVNEVAPYGLPYARRSGGRRSHGPSVDILGDLGEPIIASNDGYVKDIRYQPEGAGNYIKLMHNGFTTVSAHLMEIPTIKTYKQYLSDEEAKSYKKNQQKGYELALRRYAWIVLKNKDGEKDGPTPEDLEKLTPEELDKKYLEKHSIFYQIKERFDRGEKVIVRKGDIIGNMGRSGNVLDNNENPIMKQTHLHFEMEIDPVLAVKEMREMIIPIIKNQLNDRVYNDYIRRNYASYMGIIEMYSGISRLPDAK